MISLQKIKENEWSNVDLKRAGRAESILLKVCYVKNSEYKGLLCTSIFYDNIDKKKQNPKKKKKMN